MKKPNIKNERIKRRFYQDLKEAFGLSESTINNIARAILLYEDFTNNADFATYNSDKAKEFKEWLRERKYRGKPITITTIHSYLRYLRKFFLWISKEAGYRSRINPSSVDYLRVSKKEERIATQSVSKPYPSLEDVRKLTDSIEINSEINFRDRALIAFTLLSGMRAKAIVTLPLVCFDEDKLIVSQDPKEKVATKFSKHITTVLFNFDNELLSYVIKWVKHLKEKSFGSKDPLFPRSKLEQEKDALSFKTATEVEPVFWKGTAIIGKIFRKRAQDAGLHYYSPHTFRHLAVDLALKNCETGEQLKAISMNFGHEHVATTLSSYANFEPQRLSEILRNMDFSGKPSESPKELMEMIKKLLKKLEENEKDIKDT